jgi:hypothetical protein
MCTRFKWLTKGFTDCILWPRLITPPGSIKTNQPAISCSTGSLPHAWRTVRTTKQNKTILTLQQAKKQFGSTACFSVKLSPIPDKALLCFQVPRLCRVIFLTTVVLRCRRVHSVGIMTLTGEHGRSTVVLGEEPVPVPLCPVQISDGAWNRASGTEVSLGEVLIKDTHKFQFVPHSKQPVFSQSMQFTATALPKQCSRLQSEVSAGLHTVRFGPLCDTTAGI